MKKKQLVLVSIFFILFVQICADENKTKEYTKYNDLGIESSDNITLKEFDEWLKVNDHYEVFVKAYNTSPNHPIVKKMKCLYELESLQSVDAEMSYDDMQKKCSNQS